MILSFKISPPVYPIYPNEFPSDSHSKYQHNRNQKLSILNTNSEYYCTIPHKYMLVTNEWFYNSNNIYNLSINTIPSLSVISSPDPTCEIPTHQSEINSSYLNFNSNSFDPSLDFSSLFKKLNQIQYSLNQLDQHYKSISDNIKSTKSSHEIIRHTLENYSLEIFTLYKKITNLEERLAFTINEKVKALDYQYLKRLEKDERILKTLYDHMAQLYDTQIEFINQINGLSIIIENSNNNNKNNNYNNNVNHDNKIQEFMKRKYILLRQEMNKYKMLLTIFELPLNLLIQNESLVYFEDFLEFIKRESKAIASYIDIMKLYESSSSLSSLSKNNMCLYKNSFSFSLNDSICPLETSNQNSEKHSSSNKLDIIYELYHIYHERFLKLKQENIKESQQNSEIVIEMKNMKKQIDNAHSIIEMLNKNQENLENKFKSIEHLITISQLPINPSTSLNTSYSLDDINSNWICPYISPNFNQYYFIHKPYSNSLSTYNIQTLYQCPVFNNEFVNLVYQYVMKKIQESDHGIDRPDYALKSSGGYIVHAYTSPSYTKRKYYEENLIQNNINRNNKMKKNEINKNASSNSFIRMLLSKYLIGTTNPLFSSPELVLDPHILPGYEWIMNGSSGYITIGLAKPIYPKFITIDHLPPNLNLDGSTSSSPRYIEVIGIYDLQKFKLKKSSYITKNNNNKNENENEFTLIPIFEFDPLHTTSSITSLTITVPEDIYLKIKKPIQYLHIKILSNWGNTDYTSIYRIRVH